jgi:predicted GIY-YIG superfamily endonuclease
MYFVYVIKALKLSKKKYYMGVSSNLLRRLEEHNSSFNTWYTRNNKWKILYIEGYINKFTAYERVPRYEKNKRARGFGVTQLQSSLSSYRLAGWWRAY